MLFRSMAAWMPARAGNHEPVQPLRRNIQLRDGGRRRSIDRATLLVYLAAGCRASASASAGASASASAGASAGRAGQRLLVCRLSQPAYRRTSGEARAGIGCVAYPPV